MKRVHVFITGKVQGVFFRVYTQKEAEALLHREKIEKSKKIKTPKKPKIDYGVAID